MSSSLFFACLLKSKRLFLKVAVNNFQATKICSGMRLESKPKRLMALLILKHLNVFYL